MTNRFLIALLLAATLMVPAFAQTTDTQQPATQTTTQDATTTQQAQPTDASKPTAAEEQGMSARQPLEADTKQGFWGKLNPFARKKYVERQVSPIRNRVNEIDELSAQNARMIKDVDSRAQEGIRLASLKATEADQHAVEAGNRANQAHQTATQAGARLQTVEQVVGNLDQYQPATTTEIRFRPGQSVLSAKAKEALDEMATSLKDQRGYIIEVQGFSQGSGQTAIANSQKMADAVVRYLVLNHEVPMYRIFVVGMGNAPVQAKNAEEGAKPARIRGGRVEISLLKNNVDQLAQQQSAPAETQQQ